MNRRSFFSSMALAPAVAAAAVANSERTIVPSRISDRDPVGHTGKGLKGFDYLQSEPATPELINDAHVLIGTLHVGETLCANEEIFCKKVLRDAFLCGPYHARVKQAAAILTPFFAATVGLGYYKIEFEPETYNSASTDIHGFLGRKA